MALGIYEEEDIRAIAESIRVNAFTSKTYTTKEMADGVSEVFGAGRQEGYDKGYPEGYAKGSEDTYYEAYAKGNDDGYITGEREGKIAAYEEFEPINAELEQILYGEDTGGEGFWGEFWDAYQQNGNRTDYSVGFGGRGWTSKNFKPKYNIIPSTAYMIFRENAASIDLVDFCNTHGIIIDFSKATVVNYAFYDSAFTHLGVLDFSSIKRANNLTGAFQFSKAKTVDLIKLQATEGTYANVFSDWGYAENITIEGSINCDGVNFKASTKLTKASITSIISALSTTTSGLAVTLSKTAVNTAFETSVGANNGSTSEQWLNLIATKSNWTISLA